MRPLYRYLPVFIALLVLAILSTGFYGATIVRSLFYERIVVDLEDTALIVKNLLVAESPEDIDKFCKTAGTGQSRITVVDADGIVLGDSIADPTLMDNHGTRPEIARAYLGVTEYSIRFSDTLERDMVYLALPSFELSGKTVVLRTATALRALSGELRGAYTRISIVGAIILVLVSLLGIALTSRINGALRIIRNAVEEYAKGNFSFKPHVLRPPELRKVADTISDLAGGLLNQAAEASRQRDELETVFAGMDEAVIVLDTNLVILEMNDSARRLSDLDEDEGSGKELLLVFRNSHLYEVADRVRREEKSIEGETVVFGDNARYLQVHGTIIPGTDNDARIVLVLNDVTKLKNLEQVRKDFVANVSHELKTPITAVKGYIETLLGGDYRNLEVAESFLSIALQHVDRIVAIIEDLLIISRLEQETGIEPELASCNLLRIMQRVVQMYEKRAAEKGMELHVSCPKDLQISANEVLLEQGIANLVDNAIKYSDGGPVEISGRAIDDTVVIRVEDHGNGIPEEHLNRVFERFYRVDQGRSRELGGTGLGLAIVKHVALSHGGQVTAESTEGEGSTFSIILPRS